MNNINISNNEWFGDYKNYWHAALGLGTKLPESQQSTKNERSAALNKWKIATIIIFTLSVVTLAGGTFALVKYQDIAHRLTSTKPTFVGDNKTTPMITHTSTITTKPTFVGDNKTTPMIIHTSTITTKSTYSTTSTDSITKLSIVTTPTDAFTDVVTTNPRAAQSCPSDEDKLSLDIDYQISIYSFRLWGENIASGFLQVTPYYGFIYITNKNDEELLELNVASGSYSTASNWAFYYHKITSPEEKSAIACLLNDTQSFDGYAFTWLRVCENNEVVSTYQCIVAFYNQSRTYIIRTFSGNIADNLEQNPLVLYFKPENGPSKFFDYSLDKENIAGKRFITDASEPDYENGDITFVYQGENCDIFIC